MLGGRVIHNAAALQFDLNAQRLSRIVPVLEPGSIVTATRSSVDNVVTEQRIAELRGKSVPERATADSDLASEVSRRAERGSAAAVLVRQSAPARRQRR